MVGFIRMIQESEMRHGGRTTLWFSLRPQESCSNPYGPIIYQPTYMTPTHNQITDLLTLIWQQNKKAAKNYFFNFEQKPKKVLENRVKSFSVVKIGEFPTTVNSTCLCWRHKSEHDTCDVIISRGVFAVFLNNFMH